MSGTRVEVSDRSSCSSSQPQITCWPSRLAAFGSRLVNEEGRMKNGEDSGGRGRNARGGRREGAGSLIGVSAARAEPQARGSAIGQIANRPGSQHLHYSLPRRAVSHWLAWNGLVRPGRTVITLEHIRPLAVTSPDPPRSTSNPRLEVLRGGSREVPVQPAWGAGVGCEETLKHNLVLLTNL